jgi:hypothetical protein
LGTSIWCFIQCIVPIQLVVTIWLSINFGVQGVFVFFLFRIEGFMLLMSHFKGTIEKAIHL